MSDRQKIERFIESLPILPTLNPRSYTKALRRSNNNLVAVLRRTQTVIQEEMNSPEQNAEEMPQVEALQRIIKNEADAYQYANFYKILDDLGYINGDLVNQEGVDMLICCTKVLHLCRNKDLQILEKVKELAVLFRIILKASKVQFIVENESNRYLDRWKDDVVDEFNKLVAGWNQKLDQHVKEIDKEKVNHYMVLIEKTGNSDCNIDISEDTEKLLNSLEKQGELDNNYIIDNEKGIVLWRIKSQQRTIWINIEKLEWMLEDRLRIARDMRKVMIFYQELRREIFNTENDYFMDEISNAQRKLNIYNSNKVFTHTKEYPQIIQYNQVKNYFENINQKQGDWKIYPHYLLNLLADLSVSRYYRRGLKEPLYDELDMNSLAQWKDIGELLRNQRSFIYEAEPGERVNVRLEVDSEIKGEDRILCRGNNPDAIREFTLLLYALILNAAEKGRGVRISRGESTKECVHGVEISVIVNLKREGKYLIIQNESTQNVNFDEIKRKLKRVPESSEDGISLWSAKVYIQRCSSAAAITMINEAREKFLSNQGTKQELESLKAKVIAYLDEEDSIKIDGNEINGKFFFTVGLPIFLDAENNEE